MTARWIGLAATTLGLGAASPAAAQCKMDIVPLAVVMHGPQLRIEAQIGGRTLSLILDSGAYYSTLNPKTASVLGLMPSGASMGTSGIGGAVRNLVATAETFTVAGVEFHKVPFLVGGRSGDADGTLGENFLHLYDLEFDLRHGAVQIIRPQGCAGRSLAYWSTDAYMQAEALGDAEDRQIHVIVEINGVRMRGIIDSGAAVYLLDRDAALHAGITTHMPGAEPIGAVTGIGEGSLNTWSVPVATFKFGDETINNTRMRVGNASLRDMDIILGVDFLRAHRLYVANSQNRIYFTYAGGRVFDLATKAIAPTPEPSAVGVPKP